MKKVLVVEDNFETVDIYKKRLESEGYETISVTLGEEAVLAAKAQKPDLILLDLMLPGGTSGIEVLKQFKKEKDLKDIPVIIVTNLHTEDGLTKKMGANEYIVKANTSISNVVNTVKKHLQ